jgi:nucleoid-associated protein YgaU
VGGAPLLTSVAIVDGNPRTVSFYNDAQGQVLHRDEADGYTATGDPHEIWFRFGGRLIGYVGNVGTAATDYPDSDNIRITGGQKGMLGGGPLGTSYADFDQSIAPVTTFKQGSAEGTYTVRSGDTLSGIAAALWGDASLWYKIAEANGLSGDGGLTAGQTLRIPPGVMASAHNASTFTPYDPTAIIGNVSPTTIKPPKQKSGGCGIIGQIILVIIAVVVTWLTDGAASDALSTIGITGTTNTVAAGAIAGAAGSIASQGVGVATGIQDKFSWNGVALSAIAGGVGGSGVGKSVSSNIASKFGNTAAMIVSAAAVDAVTQGISMAVGLQSKFSWSGVAAAGVSAYAGAKYGGDNVAERVSVETIADAAARSLIDGTDFGDNIMAALPDVIGNTIGDEIKDEIEQQSQESAGDGAGIAQTMALINDPSFNAPIDFKSLMSIGPMAQTYTVADNDTLLKIASRVYGADNALAGVAVLMAANGVRVNQNGSPLIYAGASLIVPDLADYDLAAASLTGRQIVSANSAGLAAAAQRDSDIRQWLESFDATCPNGPPPPRAPSIWDDAIDQALSVGEGGRVYDTVTAADFSWLGAQGPIAERVNEAYAERDAAYSRIADGWQNGNLGDIALGGLQALGSAFNFVTSPLAGTLDEGLMALGYSQERAKGGSDLLLTLAALPAGGFERAGVEGLTGLTESSSVEPLLARMSEEGGEIPRTIGATNVPYAEGVFADMSAANGAPAFLSPAQFADLPATGTINPNVIRFSQESVGATFQAPYGSVNDLIEGLVNGSVDPSAIAPIRLVEKDGMIFTLDNRRLVAFQSAYEQAGLDIPYQKLDAIPKSQLFKFTTQNNGVTIRIRGGGQ